MNEMKMKSTEDAVKTRLNEALDKTIIIIQQIATEGY